MGQLIGSVKRMKSIVQDLIATYAWPDPSTLWGRQHCLNEASFAIRWAAFCECYNLLLIHVSHHLSRAGVLFWRILILDAVLVASALVLTRLLQSSAEWMASMIITGAISLHLFLIVNAGGAHEVLNLIPGFVLLVFAVNGVRATQTIPGPRSNSFDQNFDHHDRAS